MNIHYSKPKCSYIFSAALLQLEERAFPQDLAVCGTKLGPHAGTIMTRFGVSSVPEFSLLSEDCEKQLGLPVLAAHRLTGILAADRSLAQ